MGNNPKVREGLAHGQAMAKSGALYELGASAQPAGTRRNQGRTAASKTGASPALPAHRDQQTAAARARWDARATALGYTDLEARRTEGVTPHRIRADSDAEAPSPLAS